MKYVLAGIIFIASYLVILEITTIKRLLECELSIAESRVSTYRFLFVEYSPLALWADDDASLAARGENLNAYYMLVDNGVVYETYRNEEYKVMAFKIADYIAIETASGLLEGMCRPVEQAF